MIRRPATRATSDVSRADSLVPVGALLPALTGAVCWVLSVVRSWGDTGVTAAGSVHTGTPTAPLALTAVALVTAALGAMIGVRRRSTAARSGGAAGVDASTLGFGSVALLLAGAGTVATVAVVGNQSFPRVGGLFGLVAGVAGGVAGATLVLSAAFARRPTVRWAMVGLDVVVVAGLAAATVAVAPTWAAWRLDARYDSDISEAPVPSTVARVGWTRDYRSPDQYIGVFDGRVLVASGTTGASGTSGGGDCALTVSALDSRTGDVTWTVRRPVRCAGGAAVGSIDGDDQIVRIGLGHEPSLSGAYVYLDPATGRESFPAAGDAQVTQWTQGFGLVLPDGTGPAGGTIVGVAPRTGLTAWSRPTPHCAVGRTDLGRAPAATVQSPFDGQHPPGALPAVQVVADVVLGYSCRTTDGTVTRHVLLIDPAGTGGTDHDVTVPGTTTEHTDGPTPATTFTATTDAVVAVTPAGVATPQDSRLTAIDVASGRVLWQSAAPLPIRSLGLGATGQLVTARPAAGGSAVGGSTVAGGAALDVVVTDRRTGAELGRWTAADVGMASVQLVGGQLSVTTGDSAVTIRDVGSGTVRNRFAVPACAASPLQNPTPAFQLTPGAVVLRCGLPGGAGGIRIISLLP